MYTYILNLRKVTVSSFLDPSAGHSELRMTR